MRFGLPKHCSGLTPSLGHSEAGLSSMQWVRTAAKKVTVPAQEDPSGSQGEYQFVFKGRGLSPFSSSVSALLRMEKKHLRVTDLSLCYRSGRGMLVKESAITSD